LARAAVCATREYALQPPEENFPIAPPPAAVAARHVSGWKRLILWPFVMALRLWCRSLRFEMSDRTARRFADRAEPTIFAFWHNRLFIVTELYRRHRQGHPLHALVSASRDGAWLEAFLALSGLPAVRGSSSRGGLEAARALVGLLRSGTDAAITPDGPRGPAYNFKAGALVVARRAGTPVVLIGGRFESAWQLSSWDGFYLPRPFSRVRIEHDEVPAAELRNMEAAELAARLCALSPDDRAQPTIAI
jgi:lysophospholipid acyltransferase (LPLAT)-like uncharacterized protein